MTLLTALLCSLAAMAALLIAAALFSLSRSRQTPAEPRPSEDAAPRAARHAEWMSLAGWLGWAACIALALWLDQPIWALAGLLPWSFGVLGGLILKGVEQ